MLRLGDITGQPNTTKAHIIYAFIANVMEGIAPAAGNSADILYRLLRWPKDHRRAVSC